MNRKLLYLSIAANELSIDLDFEISEADNGKSSTVEEGKQTLLDILDPIIEQLQQFRNDVAAMPFSRFNQKYNG
nr:hypothetical protein [uncultured Draconibacterium sp.]